MSGSHQLRVLLAGGPGGLEAPLRAEGHEVCVPVDASSVLSAARATCQDVVILDLDGGGGDPFALARDIRAATPWRKPMLVALGKESCDTCCREAGIDLLLVKPVAVEMVTGFLGRLRSVVSDYAAFDPSI